MNKHGRIKDFGIINLTNKDISKELEQFLQFGANYAPHVPLSSMEVEELFGNELLAATRNMFIDTYKQFPLLTVDSRPERLSKNLLCVAIIF